MKAKFLLASFLMLATTFAFAQEEEEKAPVKRYGFKSAIVKTSTGMMGQKVETTAYIDNYGALECQKAKVNVPGVGDVETATITRDGKTVAVNYSAKQIQEAPADAAGQINFLNLDEQTVGKFNIKETGKEKVLDLDCVSYTLDVPVVQNEKAKLKVWVYKGYVLKSEMSFQGMDVKTTATEFKEDAMVLPQVFDIPKF